jgi:hypothetical protein
MASLKRTLNLHQNLLYWQFSGMLSFLSYAVISSLNGKLIVMEVT